MKLHQLQKMVVLMGLAGFLAGCATGMTPDQRAKLDAAEQVNDADRIVQARLMESTTSIANTLQLIERIERGNPAAQAQKSVQARSVNSGQVQQAAQPRQPTIPSGAVSTSGGESQSGYGPDALDSRLRINWRNGSAEELLRNLAKQMNVPFKVTGERRALAPINIAFDSESLRSILAAVGRQVDRDADIVFNRSQPQPVLELRFK